MIRDFSREEVQAAESNDTELTLGLGTVLGLGVGLVVLCGICFGLGYALGHRNAASHGAAVVFPNAGGGTLTTPKGNKPGAVGQAEASSPLAAAPDATDQTPPTARSGGDAVAEGAETQQSGSSAGDSRAKPALQVSTSGSSATPLHVQPATSQVQGWMVQIAAVSRSEDADVLVTALRKRGYTASARRELGDNLIHVQTGPFPSRNDANEIRQKLLNDWYNAIVH